MDRKAVGVAEAKKAGTLLSGVAAQSGHYAENLALLDDLRERQIAIRGRAGDATSNAALREASTPYRTKTK